MKYMAMKGKAYNSMQFKYIQTIIEINNLGNVVKQTSNINHEDWYES